MFSLVLVIRFLNSVPSLNKEGRDSKTEAYRLLCNKTFYIKKKVCVTAVVMKYRLRSKEQ